MDDRALAELFRDAADSAAQGAPPPTFDHADVLAGSERARIRKRQRVIGGTALAAAVLAAAGLGAVGLGGASLLGSTPSSDSTLAGAEPAPNARSIVPYMDAPEARSDAIPQPAPFGAAPQKRLDNCARVDDELFRMLGEALPEVRGLHPRPLPASAQCPPNGRGFEVDVNDNGIQGSLQVILSPRPTNQINVQVPPGGGVVTTGTPTDDGGWLTLNSLSVKPGRVPFKDLLRQIVSDMADEL
ncbi:hypothetical protein GCM10023321_67490 [Pseudonocardia eucalypti]|uniref:DUF3558 domain-containing protein n=1 Tax=Pseudonocardia eucalypti TaxID=648755 RepID=A0ABP9R1J9_9PSEU|nr:hypothetical protein [Pseudonocardia eucalypti]